MLVKIIKIRFHRGIGWSWGQVYFFQLYQVLVELSLVFMYSVVTNTKLYKINVPIETSKQSNIPYQCKTFQN